jgi:hypothetical protein
VVTSAVTGTGLASRLGGVSWKVFRAIMLAWVVTLPFCAAVAVLWAAVLLNPAEAQVPSVPTNESKIDPQADQVLRQMAEFYKSLKSASVEVTTQYQGEFGEDGRAFMSNVVTWHVAFQHPNHYASRIKEGKQLITSVITDGVKTAIYKFSGGYTVEDQPLERCNCTTGLLMKGVFALDESFLIRKDLYTSLMQPVRDGQYIGLEKTDAGEYHHLRYSEEKVLGLGDVTWDLWVESGEQPLVHRVVIVPLEKRIKNVEPPIIFETLEKITKSFFNWKVNPELPQETFVIPRPPKDE